MESLATGLKFRLRDVSDDEGRPLLESDASARLASLITTERRTCPYPGSRHQHAKPMNISALKQMRAHWDEVLALLRFCRTLAGAAEPAPIGRVWRAANVAALLAPYLHFRARQPLGDGKIPAAVAALFKVALGMVGPLTVLMVTAEWSQRARGEELLDFFEADERLIGRWEVCAGPGAMILEVLSTLIDGGDGGDGGDSAVLPRVLPAGEHAPLARVADVCGVFRIADYLFRVSVQQHCARLLAAASSAPDGDPLRVALIGALPAGVAAATPSLERLGRVAGETSAAAGAILTEITAALARPQTTAEHDAALATAVNARTASPRLRELVTTAVRDYLAVEQIFARAALSGRRAVSAELGWPQASGAQEEFAPTWSLFRQVLTRCLGLSVQSRDGKIVLADEHQP